MPLHLRLRKWLPAVTMPLHLRLRLHYEELAGGRAASAVMDRYDTVTPAVEEAVCREAVPHLPLHPLSHLQLGLLIHQLSRVQVIWPEAVKVKQRVDRLRASRVVHVVDGDQPAATVEVATRQVIASAMRG